MGNNLIFRASHGGVWSAAPHGLPVKFEVNMKVAWTLLMLFSLFLTGCGGGSDPVNEGKDKPKPKKTTSETSL